MLRWLTIAIAHFVLAVCHRSNLGNVEGVYSDLLLHDMGPDPE